MIPHYKPKPLQHQNKTIFNKMIGKKWRVILKLSIFWDCRRQTVWYVVPKDSYTTTINYEIIITNKGLQTQCLIYYLLINVRKWTALIFAIQIITFSLALWSHHKHTKSYTNTSWVSLAAFVSGGWQQWGWNNDGWCTQLNSAAINLQKINTLHFNQKRCLALYNVMFHF